MGWFFNRDNQNSVNSGSHKESAAFKNLQNMVNNRDINL